MRKEEVTRPQGNTKEEENSKKFARIVEKQKAFWTAEGKQQQKKHESVPDGDRFHATFDFYIFCARKG